MYRKVEASPEEMSFSLPGDLEQLNNSFNSTFSIN
jgi:hypothetical protein